MSLHQILPYLKTRENELKTGTPVSRPAAVLEFPNLKLTLDRAAAADLIAWHKTFVIDGNCSDSDEKTASLVVSTRGTRSVIFALDLQHLGIFAVRPVADDKVEVELYAETMTLP